MLGIKDYEPIFYTDINDFIKNQSKALRLLVRSTIEEIWTAHEGTNGEYWGDCPVILVIGGKQLEFCSIRDEISITWDEIDVKGKLDWYGSQELNLEWRKNAIRSNRSFIGKQIEGIEIIQMKHEAYDLSGILLHSVLWLNGIGFNTEDKYLSIINALDETGFSDVRDKNHMYTKI